ncbi:MAG: hypothetical protein ACR2NG_09725, partial [Acidimicrobiia bacterium]
ERGQVEQFLSELGSQIEVLQDELAVSTQAGVAIGIDEQEALARELHTIGGEVADILEAARSAAEGIRSRATKDADAWRTAAETESSGMVVDATEQTQSLRASAWNEGSSLLSSATAEAQSIVAAAKEEALFVRAEAEREAIRLTGDAKRDRDEMLRAARSEAEQIIDAARIESDGVLAAAGQQAELAQERARALEDRRSELLGELEATRASIGELETEIESRKLELEGPEESEVVDEDADPARSHHTSDGGSVKIVAPTRVKPMRPVDAEELVAEVAAMRAGESAVTEHVAAEAVDAATVDELIADIDPIGASDIAVDEVPAQPQSDDESDTTPIAEVEVEVGVEVESEEDAEVVVAPEVASDQAEEPPEDEAVAAEPEAAAVDPVEETTPPPPTAPAASGNDDLGSLFAQLRDPSTGTPEARRIETSHAETQPAIEAAEPATETEVTAEPEPEPAAATVTPEPVAAATDAAATLIPIQNAALRSIKRTLVDLQNEALEHLRTDDEWMPDEAFTDRFDEAFAELTLAATGDNDTAASSAFGTDLYDAVSSAMERSRASGAGERELAAATSKVFRTWRSDEAERRVAELAAAGHDRS